VSAVRVVVVDDEPLARRRILRLLKEQQDGQVDVVAVCANGTQAVEAIRETRPDLVFLDVQMPEVDGFGVLERLDGELPCVIFVTAHDQYALKAFEVHAIDYLLKPFDAERFRKAFERGKSQLERRTAGQSRRIVALLEEMSAERRTLEQRLAATPAKEAHMEWVMVRKRDKIEFLRTADIDWIEAEGNYVRLHAGRESYLIREKISTLDEKLDPDRFMRVHRSTIVNLNRVGELRPLPSGDYVVLLKDATELKLSRGYRQRLAERIGEYA
jgi:two-component system, LytTR family, response regulator